MSLPHSSPSLQHPLSNTPRTVSLQTHIQLSLVLQEWKHELLGGLEGVPCRPFCLCGVQKNRLRATWGAVPLVLVCWRLGITYCVAKVPQVGSARCLSINVIKSNCGSNWSVSVRGYERKPCWYNFSAIWRRYKKHSERSIEGPTHIQDLFRRHFKQSRARLLQFNSRQR